MILPPDKAPKHASEKPKSLQHATQLLVEKEQKLSEQDQIIQKKSDVIQSQKNRIQLLEEALRLEKTKRFGRSSEQTEEESPKGVYKHFLITTISSSSVDILNLSEPNPPA